MIDNIIDHIRKAELEARKQNFKANTIIIDTDLAKTNYIVAPFFDGYRVYPPMIMGLEVKYVNNLTKDYNVNFIVTNSHTIQDELVELRKENEMLKEKINKLKQVFESVGDSDE